MEKFRNVVKMLPLFCAVKLYYKIGSHLLKIFMVQFFFFKENIVFIKRIFLKIISFKNRIKNLLEIHLRKRSGIDEIFSITLFNNNFILSFKKIALIQF